MHVNGNTHALCALAHVGSCGTVCTDSWNVEKQVVVFMDAFNRFNSCAKKAGNNLVHYLIIKVLLSY